MHKNLLVGIEIGGTKLQIVVGDDSCQVLEKFQYKVDAAGGGAQIRSKIEETLLTIDIRTIKGIGVGFGGPVNYITGDIAKSFQVEGWSGFNIIGWLNTIVDTTISVDNDANVAALGEALFGAGKNFQRILYITLGSGVGGGFVINQNIYHGRLPGEIEIGHIRLDKSGKTLESCCSGWAVDKKIRESIISDATGMLAELAGNMKRGEAVILLQALEANDSAAWTIFNEAMDDLAFGLSHAVHLLNPDAIVIGGGLSNLRNTLVSALEEKIHGYLMKPFVPAPPIFTALLKEMTVPVGALALARQAEIRLTNKNRQQKN